MPSKSIQALGWVDYETTGLPTYGDGIVDFRDVHLLEFGLIITDLDLNPIIGHHDVLKLTPEAARALQANDFVREMHMGNGLIKEAVKATLTLADADAALADACERSGFDRGTISMAGSGVARFDSPLTLTKLPKFASWLHYAEIDTGNTRRESTLYNHNQPVVNPLAESSREGAKAHRSWADIEAHLKEARRYRDFYREAVKAIEMMERING